MIYWKNEIRQFYFQKRTYHWDGGCCVGVVINALIIELLTVALFNVCMINHRHNCHGHICSHHICICHAKKQHKCNIVSSSVTLCYKRKKLSNSCDNLIKNQLLLVCLIIFSLPQIFELLQLSDWHSDHFSIQIKSQLNEIILWQIWSWHWIISDAQGEINK